MAIAESGIEALEVAHREHLDCVLMDIQMPEMDGLEAARRLRADPATRKLVIIAISANTQPSDRDNCLAAGMNDFISKPFFPEEFYETIEKWLPGKLQDNEAPGETPRGEHAPAAIPNRSNPDIIDFSVLAKLVGNYPATLKEFALKFIDSAEKGVGEIEYALDQEDMAKLAALGHRIKSAARMAGAGGFADLCLELEKLGKDNGDIAKARETASHLRPLLKQIREYVENEGIQ